MDMVRVKALMGFTEVTPEGMKVFNRGDEGELPIARAEDRLEAGHIDLLDDEPVADATVADAITPDADETPATSEPIFTMTHKGRGNYLIEGPGIAPDTFIRGKADAEAFIKQAEKAHDDVTAALAADDQDAPV